MKPCKTKLKETKYDRFSPDYKSYNCRKIIKIFSKKKIDQKDEEKRTNKC